MTDARSPLRALRAAAFAAVCVTLAALGHSFASGAYGASGMSGTPGHEIPPGALWAAFVVTAGLAWLAGGRRRGAVSIGVALLTVQGALHLLFAGALPYGPSAHGPGPRPGGVTDMATGSGMTPSGMSPGMTMSGADTGPDGRVGILDALTDVSAGMLAAHLVAGALCALWLARGEAALFRLIHAVGVLAFSPLRLLLSAVRLPAAPRLIRPRPGASTAHRARGVVLAHTLSRRGPPAFRTARATAPGAAVSNAAIPV
ncbi:hypothetical protein [Streptomyces odonnellii]|uniref:hypothetical protein n=1 Tax=Streptomyces odonnellii TaxID=1417980 RepID=UPI0006264A6F|nr:hypothetical protein [Streptomyces odonnellii]